MLGVFRKLSLFLGGIVEECIFFLCECYRLIPAANEVCFGVVFCLRDQMRSKPVYRRWYGDRKSECEIKKKEEKGGRRVLVIGCL